jgi:hypothetical protein
MISRILQQELAARHGAQFVREAGRLNSLAVHAARAQHERHPSVLAAVYRIRRRGPQP